MKNKFYLGFMLLCLMFVGIFSQTKYADASFSDVSSTYPYYDAILYAQENAIVNGYEDGTFKPENKINRAEFTKIIINSVYGEYVNEWQNCYEDYEQEGKLCNGRGGCSQGVYNSYLTCVERIQPCYLDFEENLRVKCTSEDGSIDNKCGDIYEAQYTSCIKSEEDYVNYVSSNQEFLKNYEEFAYYGKYVESLANDYSKCFLDVKHDAWYAKYVCFAKVKKVVSGYDNGNFAPDNLINFAEAAKITVNGFNYEVTQDKVWYKPYVKALEERKAIPMSIYAFAQEITRGEFAEIVYRLRENILDKPSKIFEQLEK